MESDDNNVSTFDLPDEFGIQLREQQYESVKKIIEFYKNLNPDKGNIVILEGYAGTGKTTMTRRLLREMCVKFQLSREHVALATYTNKAARVLRNAISGDYNCSTIHSLFGIKVKKSSEELNDVKEVFVDNDQKKIVKQKTKSMLSIAKVIIIDEFSMLSLSMMKTILGILGKNKEILLIFLGDRHQLKAIDHDRREILPIFKMLDDNDQYNIMKLDKLTELIRCKSEIKEYYNYYIRIFERYAIYDNRLYPVQERSRSMQKIIDSFLYTSGADYKDVIILTCSNGARNIYNLNVKRIVSRGLPSYKTYSKMNVDDFYNDFNVNNGDLVVLDDHLQLTKYHANNKTIRIEYGKSTGVLHKGDVYVVHGICGLVEKLPYTISSIIHENEITVYYVLIRNRDDPKQMYKIPCVSHIDKKNMLCKLPMKKYIEPYNPNWDYSNDIEWVGWIGWDQPEDIKANKKLWKDKYQRERSYNKKLKLCKLQIESYHATLTHAYAMTIYMSQGSTYKYVIVDASNVYKCIVENKDSDLSYQQRIDEFLSNMYVASTRASDRLYFIDKTIDE
jgi:superfamily I DNA/RNA helicase